MKTLTYRFYSPPPPVNESRSSVKKVINNMTEDVCMPRLYAYVHYAWGVCILQIMDSTNPQIPTSKYLQIHMEESADIHLLSVRRFKLG